MTREFVGLFFLFAFSFLSVAAQEEIHTYTDRNSFSAATRDQTVHDFEGIVPNSGFKHYQREGSLRYAGLEFRPVGGVTKFGPGPVIVVGAWYQAGPAYETTSGAKLHWSPPNQPGNAYLEVTIPSGTKAVGTDLWTVQPLQSTVEVTVTTADGETRTESVSTPARPAAGFIGFISNSPIVSLRFTPAKGQTGLIVDNFTTGRSSERNTADGPRRNESIASASGNRAAAPVVRPGDRSEVAPSASPAVQTNVDRESPNQNGAHIGPRVGGRRQNNNSNNSGAIAYVRGDTEIRLINPDGTNDRRLWTHKDLHEGLGVFQMAWKPDGSELAFSSAHEAVASLYLADIYTIRPDGSGLRKLTNSPDHPGFARFPKGSVTVNLRNDQPVNVGSSSFIVTVVGADEPQLVTVPPGTSKTIVFKSVADFGNHAQPVVAMFGKFRWFIPGVDVLAGRNVIAPTFDIIDQGFESFGAFRPVWRQDGSRISYRSGLCVISSVSANPVAGEHRFDPLFTGKNPTGSCTWDFGRTPATANQVIYTDNSSPGGSNIYQITEGRAHPGKKLTQFSEIDLQLLYDLRWMPDGSGFLYSTVNELRESSNIYRYDLATGRTTQVTKLDKEFAREFSISVDGSSVVFERCTAADDDTGCDLWTAGTDGSGARLVVKNGLHPAWNR
jgi:hypothetical protein